MALPLDIQCRILSEPITPEDLSRVLLADEQLRAVAISCVTTLISSKRGEYLDAKFILGLERITSISDNIPIRIKEPQELLDLAAHPFLREATFDISSLGDDPVTGIRFFLERFPLEPRGDCPEECPDEWTFKFKFLTKTGHAIEITNNTLDISNYTERYKRGSLHLGYFYLNQLLGSTLPICRYITFFSNDNPHLQLLPCLRELGIKINAPRLFSSERFVSDWYQEGISDYYLSYPKMYYNYLDNSYEKDYSIVSDSLATLDGDLDEDETLEHIQTFFPFNFSRFGPDLEVIHEVLPGLTSLWITLSSFEQFRADYLSSYRLAGTPKAVHPKMSHLFKYPDIVLLNDLKNPRPEKEYLEIFPEELRDCVTFLSSDWLY
jgi:hypothetical protein